MPGNNGQQMRYTEDEVALLRGVFGDGKGGTNERLLKLLRKTFLPSYDPEAPVGQVVDLWMTLDLGGLSQEQAMVRLWARNTLITHVEQQLMQLAFLATMKEVKNGPVEKAEKDKKDSTK